MEPRFTPLFIDGVWRGASTGSIYEVRNPTTGRIVGTAASASAEDCEAAIEAAARAFPAWEALAPATRRDIFVRAADIIAADSYREKVARTVQEETSAPADRMGSNYFGLMGLLRNIGGLITQLKGETFPSGIVPGAHVFAQRRALGVVFGIAPWNAPTGLTIRAAAIPMICGNTVVLKCSEYSPATQAIIVEVFEKAGLPRGVLNFISVSREDSPARTASIIGHPAVRKINFTGSDRVGRIIAGEAAKYLKPCALELGGKAPVVVLEDADIVQAAQAITYAALANSGQICMSTERVIVQRGAATALVQELTRLFRAAKGGNVEEDPSAVFDALFTLQSAENVISMIKEAVADGAKLVVGDLHRDGNILQAHIVMDVKPSMRLWQRESFGPVIALAVVDTVDDAVELANTSEYSMASALWTRDVNRAFDTAARIHASSTSINGPTIHVEWMRNLGGLGGSSGYGGFTVDDWTDVRLLVLYPATEQTYPAVQKIEELAPKSNGELR